MAFKKKKDAQKTKKREMLRRKVVMRHYENDERYNDFHRLALDIYDGLERNRFTVRFATVEWQVAEWQFLRPELVEELLGNDEPWEFYLLQKGFYH